MVTLTRMQRRNLSDEVANKLRDLIISGQLVPGERINLDDVAVQLGMSRMPVRDAVLALSHEGLTVVQPRRGVVVSPLTQDDILDTCLAMSLIVKVTGERAAHFLSDEEITELERLHHEMEGLDSASADRREQLNWKFHAVINRASRSRKLTWLLRLLGKSYPRHYRFAGSNWSSTADKQHDEILGALRARHATLAGEPLFRHVYETGVNLADRLDRNAWTALVTTPMSYQAPDLDGRAGAVAYRNSAHRGEGETPLADSVDLALEE